MSSPSDSPPNPKKRPVVSMPFLVVVGALAVLAYFAGPHVMKWIMYQQELAKSKQVIVSGSASDQAPDEVASTGGGGRGRGNFDPQAFFAEQDADGNGMLEGDEISERLRDGLDETDTDGDGAVSQEEFLNRIQQRRGRGRGPGRGDGQGQQRPASESESPSGTSEASDTSADNPPAVPQTDPAADSSTPYVQETPDPDDSVRNTTPDDDE